MGLGSFRRLLRNRRAYTLGVILALGFGLALFGASERVRRSVSSGIEALPEASRTFSVVGTSDVSCSSCFDLLRPEAVESWSQDGLRTVAFWGTYRDTAIAMSGGIDAEATSGVIVTHDFFLALGVTPQTGRLITREDYNSGRPVLVLAEGLWKRLGRPLINTQLSLNGHTALLVGVLPTKYIFPSNAQLWLASGSLEGARGSSVPGVAAVVRVRAGVTQGQLLGELLGHQRHLSFAVPGSTPGISLVSATEWGGVGSQHEAALLMLATAALLLITILNVGVLALASITARTTEFSIRHALGATRRTLRNQLIGEHLPLTTTAAGCAIVLMVLVGPLISRQYFAAFGDAIETTPDLVTVGVGIVVALLVTVGLGTIPIPVSASSALINASHGGTANPGIVRLRYILASVQVTVAVMLCFASVLLFSSYRKSTRLVPGFDLPHLTLAELQLSVVSPLSLNALERETASLRGAGGRATLVGFGSIPFNYSNDGLKEPPITVEGGLNRIVDQATDPWRYPNGTDLVGSEFFGTVGLPLKGGRPFDSTDTFGSAPVAIVNETAVATLWQGQNPIGKRLTLAPPGHSGETVTIIGVVSNSIPLRTWGAELALLTQDRPWPAIYRPLVQASPNKKFYLLVRSADPKATSLDLKRTLQAQLPKGTVEGIAPFEERMFGQQRVKTIRTKTVLLGAASLAAVLLCLFGLYAVCQSIVLSRLREIGVRLALGARAPHIAAKVMRPILLAVIGGGVVGLCGAIAMGTILAPVLFGTSRLFPRGQLYGLQPGNPVVAAILVGILAVMVFLSTQAPIRRALRVDPLDSIRQE